MIYAYCRKGNDTSAKKIQEWANNHLLNIDEFFWDDDAKQKDSYDKRKLGILLFPKLQKGDFLIVSEVSCVGRSAIELQRIIDTVFAPRMIRVAILSINFDVDFANVSAQDSELLDKFFFAAKLQKTIVHETTKAALVFKRNSGVKLGASNEKYQKTYLSRSKEERELISIKRGLVKGRRNIEKPETLALIKILRETFNLDDDESKWNWDIVSTKKNYREQLTRKMKKIQESEGIFENLDFANYDDTHLQRRLSSLIYSVRRSLTTYYANIRFENMTVEEYIKYKSAIKKQTKEKIVNVPQPTKKKRQNSKNSEGHSEITIDTIQLRKIEEKTKESQRILSDIFAETNSNEDYSVTKSSSIMDILKVLFTKDVWSYEEVEAICKKRKLMIGSVLEQINDYALETIDDIIIEDDGDNIYITTEYKNELI